MAFPGTEPDGSPAELLWEADGRAFYRWAEDGTGGQRQAFVSARPTSPDVAVRLQHEYDLRDYLDPDWSLRPTELVHESGRTMLVVDCPGNGRPLTSLVGRPMELGRFLRLAAAVSAAVGRLHGRGLMHRDLKPSHVIVDVLAERAWLTGFGTASRLLRERQPPQPPELIAGTLAYMAPEQTGRMNRCVDCRADLYSLGVIFYEALTGQLPFSASDPTEWVHCHIARRPANPSERLAHVPTAVSSVILKLLAKAAEDRYQSALGVERDLRHCLAEWETQGHVHDFPTGRHDAPDRLMIPEKLYGRESEVGTLLATFDRVAAGGGPELVLVSGYSGVGKSAVVNELQRPMVPARGWFATGKFDQYKRDIPYATLAQAFQGLVRTLLGKAESELLTWREAFREVLAPNALLMVELVPELRHLIGDQPAVSELPAQETQARFLRVLRSFIGVFARSEHPLVLFLDDLQWLDAGTLDLLEELLTCAELRHLLLIGAYRDNEVGPSHPWARTLQALRDGGLALKEIVLAPLGRDDIGQLMRDSLRCERERVDPLVELIHQKTAGNPFFAIQFISTLTEEGLVAFDYGDGQWSWDLDRIRAKGYTDNVVALLVGKLSRLPVTTQRALQQFACMGNSATFEVLRLAGQGSIEEMHGQLWEAVRAGLVYRSSNAYQFLHDRVQEAAYSMIPVEQRAHAHLRLGRLLAEHTPAAKLEEAVFEIANQLNRGTQFITSTGEREQVATFNLVAGRRAKTATAYVSALAYLRAGQALLNDETWERNYALIFRLECLLAECEMLTGQTAAAATRLAGLAERAQSRHDGCTIALLRIRLCTAQDDYDRGLDVFLNWLRRDGTVLPKNPSREDAIREYEAIWHRLGNRTIEELVELPLVTDTDILDTLDVFTEAVTTSYFFDEHLSSLIICRLVNLSLEHGNCDASCFAYVWMAIVAGPRFDNYRDGFRFAQLGYELVEKRGLLRYQARTYLCVGALVMPWTHHPASGRDLIRRAFDTASRLGDLTFAGYSWNTSITIGLAAGDPLAQVQAIAEDGIAFAGQSGLTLVSVACRAHLGLVRSLRGLTPAFGRMDLDDRSEQSIESELAANPMLALGEFYYWCRKLQARFFAGDEASAVDAASHAQRLLWSSTLNFESAEFRFYGALAHAAAWDRAASHEKGEHAKALTAHHVQLQAWKASNPTTFETRASLVAAEIARIEGRVLDAEGLYETAARTARTQGFVHNEALALELAGRFHAARGFDRIASTYLLDARDGYRRWGAEGKVRQLDQLYPHIVSGRGAPEDGATIQTSVERLDLTTVMKVSEALSGEIVLEKLIDILMHTAIEHAGAERGVLLLPRGDEYRVEAEATTSGGAVHVHHRRALLTADDLPESIFRFVQRTREGVVLSDALADNASAADTYIREHRARSVLCLPILKQARLLGMLYLENSLTVGAFTAPRMAVLKLIASEAATSIENARLYRDLADREARIRRLVDANIIGVFFWDLKGRILQANDAFLRMVGFDRADLASGLVRWTELTPPEWRDRDAQAHVPELRASGRLQPYEKEFFRKDGSRVPVLIGAAAFEGDAYEGVAFVLDLTERKRAAEAMREAQAELTHANRLATLGQLAASIAHEVNQPIGAARNNASAALRFLARDPAPLEDVREAVECIVNDTGRAGGIIGRIRDQVKKAPARKESVDLNDAVADVVAFVRGELSKHRVALQAQLGQGLPLISADRVQLQQVVLNLVLNAIEAMAGDDGEDRCLVIRTESDAAAGLLVTIGDSGPGIAPENRERVFDSFYTTKASGVGIGLSICRSIIDAHGGKLWVEAHAPRGAAFRFTLPALS